MPPTSKLRRDTQVAMAATVRPGNFVRHGDHFVEIVRVRRAPDRKPPPGEDLDLVATDKVVKVNSLDGLRIRARN